MAYLILASRTVGIWDIELDMARLGHFHVTCDRLDIACHALRRMGPAQATIEIPTEVLYTVIPTISHIICKIENSIKHVYSYSRKDCRYGEKR